MQAQDEPQSTKTKPRFRISNLIWGGVFGVMMLGLAGFGAYVYRHVPTSDWRVSRIDTPWRATGVEVEEAEAFWRNSAGHARMELRAAYYPVIRLKLGACEGSGNLIIRFADASGVQMGEMVSIAYSKGAFHPSRDTNVHTEGNMAEAYIETGFPAADDFLVHKFTESAPLWRVYVLNRPSGTYDEQYMGYTAILPEEQ